MIDIKILNPLSDYPVIKELNLREDFSKLTTREKTITLLATGIISILTLFLGTKPYFKMLVGRLRKVDEEQQYLFEKLKSEVRDGWGISVNIKSYGIKDEKKLFEIAKIAAEKNDWMTLCEIRNCGIKNEKYLFELAKVYGVTTLILQHNWIRNERYLFELAMIEVMEDSTRTSQNIHCYGIKNEVYLFELAKIAASKNGSFTSHHIQNYRIKDEKKLFEIAMTAAENDPYGMTDPCMKNYGIKNEEYLFQIVKIAFEKDPFAILYIQDYGIKNELYLFDLAMIGMRKNSNMTSQSILNFGIEDEEKLFKLAKIAAENDGGMTSFYIQNYRIKDEKKLFEIAMIAARQDRMNTSRNIQKYGIKDQKKLIMIFCHALAQSSDVIQYLSNYVRFGTFKEEVLGVMQTVLSEKECLSLTGKIDRESERNQILLYGFLGYFHYVLTNEQAEDIQTRNEWLSQTDLIDQIIEFRDPKGRFMLSDYLATVAGEASLRDIFDEMAGQKHVNLVHLLLASIKGQGVSGEICRRIGKFVNKNQRTLKDKPKRNMLLKIFSTIEKEKGLTLIEKEQLLRKLFPENKTHDFSETFTDLRAVMGILDLGFPDLLKGSDPFDSLFAEAFRRKVPIGEIKGFTEKYEKTLALFRMPDALMTYAGIQSSNPEVLKSIGEYVTAVLEGSYYEMRYRTEGNPHLQKMPEELLQRWREPLQFSVRQLVSGKVEAQETFDMAAFLRRKMGDRHIKAEDFPLLNEVLQGRKELKLAGSEIGKKIGLDKDNPLLKLERDLLSLLSKKQEKEQLSLLEKLERSPAMKDFGVFLQDLEDAKQGVSRILQEVKQEEMIAIETDDPCDCLLSGTEVMGSCQRVDGSLNLNKCLMAYILDGKNKVLAIKKSKEDKIEARAILRLLLDDAGHPVLFFERIYPDSALSEHKRALLALAKKKAEYLQVPLLSKEINEGQPYAGRVQSLGGPAPWEYVDAGGGVYQNSVFEITGTKVLFQPDLAAQRIA